MTYLLEVVLHFITFQQQDKDFSDQKPSMTSDYIFGVLFESGFDDHPGECRVSIRQVVTIFTGYISKKSIRDHRHLITFQELSYYLW